MAVERLPIDKDKLYDALNTAGIDKQEVGIALGYTKDWLSSAISHGRGTLPKWVIIAIEAKFNILYDMIKPVSKEPKVEMATEIATKPIFIEGFSKDAMRQLVECFYEALERPTQCKGEKDNGN